MVIRQLLNQLIIYGGQAITVWHWVLWVNIIWLGKNDSEIRGCPEQKRLNNATIAVSISDNGCSGDHNHLNEFHNAHPFDFLELRGDIPAKGTEHDPVWRVKQHWQQKKQWAKKIEPKKSSWDVADVWKGGDQLWVNLKLDQSFINYRSTRLLPMPHARLFHGNKILASRLRKRL